MEHQDLKLVFSKATNILSRPKKSINIIQASLNEMPELKGLKIEWPAQGKLAHVAFIGDYVVKAPRPNSQISLKKTTAFFKKELAWLQRIEKSKKFPLVPKIKHISDKFNFCIIQKMPGIPLKEVQSAMTTQENERVAETMAQFTYDFSEEFPVKKYAKHSIVNRLSQQGVLNYLNKSLLKRSLTKQKIQNLWGETRCNEYIEIINAANDIYKNKEPIMFHNDLHNKNILVNPSDAGEVTGIIDFGIVGVNEIPEIEEALNYVGPNIQSSFSTKYYKYKKHQNGYDTLSTLRASNQISYIFSNRKHVTDIHFQKTDKLVAQSRII